MSKQEYPSHQRFYINPQTLYPNPFNCHQTQNSRKSITATAKAESAMADDFDAAGVNSWWNINTSRATTTSTSSDITASSYDNSPAIQPSTTDVGISGLHQIPGFTMDWNQSLLRSNTSSSGRAEPSFHAMLQDSYNYPSSIESGQFFQPQQQQHQHQQQQVGLFPMMLQGLFEPEPTKAHQQHNFDPHSFNYSPHAAVTMMGSSISDSLQKLPQFLKSSPPAQPPPDQLQFSNNTDFWNASEVRSPGFYSAAAQMPVQFEQKPSCSTSSRVSTTKSNSESAVSKRSGGSGSEPALKKTRTETLSPLPTFKVRKEKLSDRITALQQLVSPFGKTDTASVLHEAIEYIKFLHEQVNVLTSPYLKNGNPMQHQQSSGKSSKDGDGGPKQDLRSRGLCLVPVESTYPVASETTADFWPSFGGSYR